MLKVLCKKIRWSSHALTIVTLSDFCEILSDFVMLRGKQTQTEIPLWETSFQR